MFSFGGKRRPKLKHESVSAPLSAAETQYIESRGPRTASVSLQQDRWQHGDSFKIGRYSFLHPKTMDKESVRSTSISIDRDSQKQFASSRQSTEVNRPEQLRNQASFASISSYYDRKKYPLSITQQTSASSVRDAALRKGCPTVGSVAPPTPKKDALRKRPSRLDFSTFFARGAARQEQALSPRRSTHPPISPISPPLVSARSDTRPRSFFRSSTADPDNLTLYSSPKSAKRISTFAKINIRKPSHGVQNWFDGLEGYVSDEENDFEPDMHPDYVDTNYGTPYTKSLTSNKSMPELRPESTQWQSYPSEPVPPLPVTPSSRIGYERSFSSSDRLQVGQKSITTATSISMVSSFSALSSANLHEDSILLLTSSDDEDEVVVHTRPRQKGIRKTSIRDSVGTDLLDSDVEICTAQAIQPATLWSTKTLTHSKSLPGGGFSKQKHKAGNRDSQIPSRRSSKHSVARLENHDLFSGTDAGILKTPVVYQVPSDSASNRKWKRKSVVSTVSSLGQSPPRIMALTSQEASLLEAMRSKKAAMRRNILNEINNGAMNGTSLDNRPLPSLPRRRERPETYMHSDQDSLHPKRPNFGHSATNDSSLASERASLIFSEGLSSPATGRLSPTTPTLESFQDYSGMFGSGVKGDQNSHAEENMGRSGHARCRTSSSNIVVLDHLQPLPEVKPGNEEYPWGFL